MKLNFKEGKSWEELLSLTEAEWQAKTTQIQGVVTTFVRGDDNQASTLIKALAELGDTFEESITFVYIGTAALVEATAEATAEVRSEMERTMRALGGGDDLDALLAALSGGGEA